MKVFNVKEEELLREEEIDYEQGECTQEVGHVTAQLISYNINNSYIYFLTQRLVDGHSETISSQTLSRQLHLHK